MTSSILIRSLSGVALLAGLALSTPAFSQTTANSGAIQPVQAPGPDTTSQAAVTKQHVDGGQGPIPNTFFNQLPGVIAHPSQQPAQNSR